jgi:putative ubiquitin-RnfH superfamily antitoxin RatB of RatAB toxin-antitoxin module
MGPEGITVEVAYARPERQWLVRVNLPAAATVADAVHSARNMAAFPELGVAELVCAVWGELRPLDHPLRPGDRVEILRPLRLDPPTARRELAAAGRVMGQAGGASSD